MVAIRARDLTVHLGSQPVVSNVTTEMQAGMLVGIVGPNGAGKSSFVRALLGLVASEGAIEIDGRALETLSRAEIARIMAYLPQGQTLHWPLSVERLIALGRLPHLGPLSRLGMTDRAAIARAMTTTGVADLASRPAIALSGGERALVLIARALAVEAPVLVVDEPLAALDPAHQLQVMEVLRAEADRGALVIAVLHDLGIAARFCDRLLLFDRGRLAVDDVPAAVLTPDHLRAIYGVEAWFGSADGAPLIVPLRRGN